MKHTKTKTGKVLSTAMQKSVVVLVERGAVDPIYKKHLRRKSKFMAHDEKNECQQGDVVEISECRPLSKRKRWRVSKILARSTGALVRPSQEMKEGQS